MQLFHHQLQQQLIANTESTRQNTQPSSQMNSPQNSSIFASSASSASASSLSQASSHVTTISNVVTSFTPHDVHIFLQTSFISPSADMQTSIGRNFECRGQLPLCEKRHRCSENDAREQKLVAHQPEAEELQFALHEGGGFYLRALVQEKLDESERIRVKESFAEIWSIAMNEHYRINKRNLEMEGKNCSKGKATDYFMQIRMIDNDCNEKKKGKTKTIEVEIILFERRTKFKKNERLCQLAACRVNKGVGKEEREREIQVQRDKEQERLRDAAITTKQKQLEIEELWQQR